MVNTIFKGDVAEISWGKETGFKVDGTGDATGFQVTSVNDTSIITLGTASYWVGSTLLIPDNSLVGCILRISSSGNFANDDYASTRRTYYIVANDTTNKTITVQPKMATIQTADTNTSFQIDAVRCPTPDTAMTDTSHGVKTDQFFGLLDNFSLPEPDIDVRMQHVIGMGRDVNVLTSGKETLTGGSFTANAHNFRWMRYGLGGHTAISQGEFIQFKLPNNNNSAKDQLNLKQGGNAEYAIHRYGTGEIDLTNVSVIAYTGNVFDLASANITEHGVAMVGGGTATGSSVTCVFKQNISLTHHVVPEFGGVFKTLNTLTGNPCYGNFDSAATTTLTGTSDIISLGVGGGSASGLAAAADKAGYVLPPIAESIKRGDIRVKLDSAIIAGFAVGDYINIIDGELHTIPGQDAATTNRQIPKCELRRVIGIEGQYLYVEEPFFFAHKHGTASQTSTTGVERIAYNEVYSPSIHNTTKELKFGVVHTMFGDTSLPTFMIEQSFRRDDASPGAEQLLRLYNGCKVQSVGFSANTEGEVKLQVDYEAGRHYTDTAGVFSPKRMFEDIADTAVNRSLSGIAMAGEKPYLFQDMNISIFGQTVLRATQVNFQLNNSNETRHYIRGYSGVSLDTDQVQQAGVQMPMDYTEAKREYSFTFSAIIEDDQLWNQMRTRKHHRNQNDIVMTLKKVGGHATRESATITIEDYTIKKADHQIPDSKGAVVVDVELIVRHLKVVENSVYLGY